MRMFQFHTAAGAAGVLLFLASVAPAQFRANPNQAGSQPTLQTQGMARPVANTPPQYIPPAPQAGGGLGYYGGVIQSPVGGYMSGAANVIDAQANFMQATQQTNLMQQDVKRSKLETRRAKIDEMLYEKAVLPTQEDLREEDRQMMVRRSLNDPPFTEIINGSALNILLGDATRMQITQRMMGPHVPLSPDLLRRINVSTGTTAGTVAPMAGAGNFKWPVVLMNPIYEDVRKDIDKYSYDAVKQVQSGGLQFETNQKLNTSITRLENDVRSHVEDVSMNDYILAKRFINELKTSTRALQDASAPALLSGKLAAQGNTVAELVANMNGAGLRFAPASTGNEAAYRVLHQSFVTYDSGLAQMFTAQMKPATAPPGGGQPPR